MNAYEKDVHSLVYQAWRLASPDARRRYDKWMTEHMEISMCFAEWGMKQLKWMESDTEWAECVMLARLMG